MFPGMNRFNVKKGKYANFVRDDRSALQIYYNNNNSQEMGLGNGFPYIANPAEPYYASQQQQNNIADVLPVFPDFAKMDCKLLPDMIKELTKKRNSPEVINNGPAWIEAYEHAIIIAQNKYDNSICTKVLNQESGMLEPVKKADSPATTLINNLAVNSVNGKKIPWTWIIAGIGALAIIYIAVPGKQAA